VGITDILVTLIGGTAVGVLGKATAPGDRDNVPLWLTSLCGMAGIVLGSLVYTLAFGLQTSGVDWWRHVTQVVCALVPAVLAARLTARRTV
jgi:uncharacterized membrane protein YeaQ/YmgE (transglycosylase-associated protein family)